MNKGKRKVKYPTPEIVFDSGKSFLSNNFVRFSLLLAVLGFMSSFGLCAWAVRSQPFPVILHYNVYFGVDLIGVWWQVFVVPGVAFGFASANAIIANHLYKHKERVGAYVLLVASVLLSVGIFISCIGIALINY